MCLGCRAVVVLEASGSAPKLIVDASYRYAALPFACQLDVTLRVANSTSSLEFGRLVSYAPKRPAGPGVASSPNGSFVCADGFVGASGDVACRQLGFDKSVKAVDSSSRQPDALTAAAGSTHAVVGQQCLSSGACSSHRAVVV